MEEEIKTSSRLLVVSAIVLLVILLTGPLGYRYGVVELMPSLISIVIAFVGGGLVVLVGLVYLVFAIRGGLPGNRNQVILAMALSLVPAFFVLPQMMTAWAVPPINDITTDPENPPAFVAVAPLRAEAPNPVTYGASGKWPADKLGAETRRAYPDLQPIRHFASVEEAVAQSESVLKTMGLEIVDVNADEGRVEATATTFWFGFRDDVVVRVVAEDDGDALIDLRSKSRVGQSDIGANAARIRQFISLYDADD